MKRELAEANRKLVDEGPVITTPEDVAVAVRQRGRSSPKKGAEVLLWGQRCPQYCGKLHEHTR